MTKNDFKEDLFRHKILLNADIGSCFDAFATDRGLSQWLLERARYIADGKESSHPVPGSRYLFDWKKNYSLSGVILDIKTPDYIRFTFGSSFEVEVYFKSRAARQTEILLVQYNLFPNTDSFPYINCCVCWGFFLTNLKSALEYGIDLREVNEMNETFINQ